MYKNKGSQETANTQEITNMLFQMGRNSLLPLKIVLNVGHFLIVLVSFGAEFAGLVVVVVSDDVSF